MNLTRLLLIIGVLAAFAIAPAVRARTSDDQIKSAGGIELTTEIAAVNDTEPDTWAAAVNSKCPKTAEHLKTAGITADELMKGALAILACFMDEKGELPNSDNEPVKANVEFVKANKERADSVGGAVMMMGQAPDAASDSAKKP